MIPSDSALANSPSMRLVAHRPKRERDEAAEARPGETGKRDARAGDEARFLRRLDLELRFVDRRRRGGGGNWFVLERMIASGA